LPTPLTKQKQPDLEIVVNVVDKMLPFVRKNQVISLESTTYPGTTVEIVQPKLEQTGLKIGKDLFLVYSPEREDPGNKNFSIENVPKICSGVTAACLKLGLDLYSHITSKLVPVSSTQAAELTKLFENIYRSVNVGLVNEMKIVADRIGIDIYEIVKAAATKPFGFTAFYPGPGLGGHCLPIDPFYLTWKMKEYELNTKFG
jgi:UDP-N-acetyl-D-glucosamine dehydrogenase